MIMLILLLIVYQISPHFVHSFPSQPENNSLIPQHQPLSAAPKDTCLNSKHAELWREKAINAMWEERKRMAFTPLVLFDKIPSALLLFKNESASATESLKHRYSWALVMWALLMGYISPNTTVYEASSGNTARSEAYMCSLIGTKYVTVLPDTTELLKVQKIENAGGEVRKIPFGNTLGKAEQMAQEDRNGFFINQFGNSEIALDYHESGDYDLASVNTFHEILAQMKELKIVQQPTHFIFSAATGGTISSIGRYVKKYELGTEIVLADTEFSAYYDLLVSGRFENGAEDPQPLWSPPGMAGTGFGWAGPIVRGKTSSLIPEVIDRALKIPDLASVAGMHILREHYGIDGGPSTGVNFAAALKLIGSETNANANPPPKLVLATLIADPGANYRATYYNHTWIGISFAKHGGLHGLGCWQEVLQEFIGNLIENGTNSGDPIASGAIKCMPMPKRERKRK